MTSGITPLPGDSERSTSLPRKSLTVIVRVHVHGRMCAQRAQARVRRGRTVDELCLLSVTNRGEPQIISSGDTIRQVPETAQVALRGAQALSATPRTVPRDLTRSGARSVRSAGISGRCGSRLGARSRAHKGRVVPHVRLTAITRCGA
jgi:hypothetical protein